MDGYDRALALLLMFCVAAVIGLVVWLVVDPSAAQCPKGQHAAVLYYQPIVTTVSGVTSVTMTPVYGCQS